MLNSDDLINKVKVYNKFLNPERLDKAFNFAVKAHQNQKELRVTLTQSIQSR